MPEIVEAQISAIAINPYRRLHTYPYIQSKIEALQRSIADVGLWPSVIARPMDGDRLWKYELAFGHHRVEAARRLKLTNIPLIVEKLTDRQMLQYMGRENLEDYNAVFLIQLESWEAALKSGLVPSVLGKTHQPIEIAKILGWTDIHSKSSSAQLNHTALACNAAYVLIEGGYLSRETFADLNVTQARNIAQSTLARMEQIEKIAAGSARPRREIENAKQKYGQAATETAQQVRSGSVVHRDIRSRVDFNAAARTAGERPSPLFAVFANAVADNLRRTLQTDSDAQKLTEIEKVLHNLSLLEDWEAYRRLDVELLNLSKRAEGWHKRLIPPQEKIVQFKALEAKGE
jgi:hypothetical protein